jgi:hypothetical protein
MQLFGLEITAQSAADLLCDTHVHSQSRETTQILYTALWIHGVVPHGEVDCSAWGKGKRPAYKPFSENHPIVQWAAGAQSHYRWVLQHAIALAETYEHRSGHKHMCAAFINHIVEHVNANGLPNTMPVTVTPQQWLEWVSKDKRAQWEPRIAIRMPPNGCEFGIVAIKDFEGSDARNWVKSYREYYVHKERVWADKEKRAIVMQWSEKGELGAKKRKRESTER